MTTRVYEIEDGAKLTLTTYRHDEVHPAIALTGTAGIVFDMGTPDDDPEVHVKLTALSGGIAHDPCEIVELLRAVADMVATLPAPTAEHP